MLDIHTAHLHISFVLSTSTEGGGEGIEWKDILIVTREGRDLTRDRWTHLHICNLFLCSCGHESMEESSG